MTLPPDRYQNFDDYLEDRLAEWGEWLRTGNYFGIGYSNQSILNLIREGKIITRNKNFYAVIETHERAEEIEALVADMATYKLEMAQVLRSYYLDHLSLRSHARKFNISHNQYNIYLKMAKQWLVGRLSSHITTT